MEKLGMFGATVADDLEAHRATLRMRAGVPFGAGALGGIAGMGLGMGMGMGGMAGGFGGLDQAATAYMNRSDEFDTGTQPQLVTPTVREAFADTALWTPSLETDADGVAEVSLIMPQNLTTWKVRAWGIGRETEVGQGEAEIVTRKDLIVRLQAPRFFLERDEVVLSANVHNYLSSAKQVQVLLEMEGGALEPLLHPPRTVQIEPGGEARVDWRVRVVREGQAVIRVNLTPSSRLFRCTCMASRRQSRTAAR
jgi:uncharacterized protein YfaS (alpha-2-macroglobulin family)